jgi:hypothetical protein
MQHNQLMVDTENQHNQHMADTENNLYIFIPPIFTI